MYATIPKGNMGYAEYTVPDIVGVEPTFVAFLEHSIANTCLWLVVAFFQIYLKNSELKTIHS